MPAVFVHGVPDTPHIWEPLIQQLSRKDVIALGLPGFGSPLPDDFDCTKESYVQWLIEQLASNLLAFNNTALYEDSGQSPCSGKEAYLTRYVPAFNQVAEELGVQGIELAYVGNVAGTILGPSDPSWDILALVTYPDFSALRRVIESPVYLRKAEPHRIAALRAWEFVATFSAAPGS